MQNQLEGFFGKYMLPIARKLEKQKHLQAIKDGIIATIPIIIVGSICLLPIAFLNMLENTAVAPFIESTLPFFSLIGVFTNDALALFAAFYIARELAKKYTIYTPQIGAYAIIVQLILTSKLTEEGDFDATFLGSQGLFIAIFAAIISVEVTRLLIKKNIVIKLPDSVPEMVSVSFSSLIPLVVNTFLAATIALLSTHFTGKLFPELIMSLLSPAIQGMDSLGALVIVILITQLLWFFGLHGPSITSAVWAPFAIAYGAENIANYQAGLEVSHIFTFGLYYNILQVTGSGLTLGLVILAMRSKNKAFSSIGKASIIPSLFGINEPIIFGLPIILNPFLFIPFVFGPVLITILTYFMMKLGFIGMPIANPPGFMPPGVGSFLMTLDVKAVIYVFICLILMTFFYYPFFKMMEKEELKKISES